MLSKHNQNEAVINRCKVSDTDLVLKCKTLILHQLCLLLYEPLSHNKCFQYTVTVALNYEEIKKDPQRITKVEPFINKYNWEGINYSSKKDDWKKFEKNNVAIALNVLYVKKEKIYPAYVSKHNSNHGKRVILLMTSNGDKQFRSTIALSCSQKAISIIKRNNF